VQGNANASCILPCEGRMFQRSPGELLGREKQQFSEGVMAWAGRTRVVGRKKGHISVA
jgi:hypothetical protein